MIDEAKPTPTEREAREEQAKQLRLAYGRIFGSQDGQLILADLKKRYGFGRGGVELPCYVPLMAPNDFIPRDGMREPVRYILRQITPNDGEHTQPNEAQQ